MRGPDEAWWKSAVIYQVYPRSFADTTGSGVGDLEGVRRKIPYLAETLGVDAIWLSPFYPSPQADFGYDVADYTGVDPQFGTLDDFDRLVEDLHRYGLRLIVDFVPNHSSDQHPWFLDSRASRTSDKRDWYTWRDPAPDGGPPNNWLSVFGGSAWEWDPPTSQFYLHKFLKEQPDLNWRNPEVKRAMFDALRFWMKRGVDGFRIDVAHYIMKHPELLDNPPAPGTTQLHKSLGDYDSQLHVHDKGHPDIHPLFRELRAVLDEYPDKYAVGEIHIFDWAEWASYYGAHLDELHQPYNFGLLGAPYTAAGFRSVVDAVEAAIPPGAWPNYVLGNHDEARLTSRYGDAAARLLALLLLTLRGTPTIYYGDEIGMLEAVIPPEAAQDPWGKNVPGLGRDGSRTPMQWSPEGGFSTNPEPWLPMGPDLAQRNVAMQLEDPASLLTLYRRLLAVRRDMEALRLGDYEPVDQPDDAVFSFLRRSLSGECLVACNLSDRPATLDPGGFVKMVLSTDPTRRGSEPGLGPHEGIILT